MNRRDIAQVVETALNVFPEGMTKPEITDGLSNLAWLTADAILALPTPPAVESAGAYERGVEDAAMLADRRLSLLIQFDKDRPQAQHRHRQLEAELIAAAIRAFSPK